MRKLLHYLSASTLLQYILPLTCFVFALVTQRHSVETDGAYAWLYGLPFPFISDAWSTSLHHSVYLLPAFIDFFAYLVVMTGLVVFGQFPGVVLKSHWFPMILVWIAIGVLYAFQFFLFADYNSYSLLYDTDFTTTDTTLTLGLYPKK